MHAFADLLDRLGYTRSRNAKLKLIAEYLRTTPDPDRGWAMAALTGELNLPTVKAGQIRTAVEARVDPVLFGMSYDYVGDLAETVALIWPAQPGPREGQPSLGRVVDALQGLGRAEAPAFLERMLDALDDQGRYALLKLVTGALRVGASARLAKTALAQAFDLPVDDVEEA